VSALLASFVFLLLHRDRYLMVHGFGAFLLWNAWHLEELVVWRKLVRRVVAPVVLALVAVLQGRKSLAGTRSPGFDPVKQVQTGVERELLAGHQDPLDASPHRCQSKYNVNLALRHLHLPYRDCFAR
jgi:hypothetical protein